jgi:hypothetical protein
MANMSMGDRGGIERAAMGNEALLRTGTTGRRVSIAYVLIGLAVFAALSYAAIEAIHGWDHIIVIADIVIVVLALAFFLHRRPGTHDVTGGGT